MINTKLTEVNELYNKVALFFAEDPKKTPPDQLFSIITQFIEIFKVTILW